MADFEIAFEKTMRNEGGYALTNDPVDRGGMTYAGIARKMNPVWDGWSFLDRDVTPPTDLVRLFYRENFWDAVKGDSIIDQGIANNLYDFGVNAGPKTAIKLAQVVINATPDGVLGPKSLMAINSVDGERFKMAFALAKVARYHGIIKRDPSQKRFITGWLARTLEQAS